MSTAAKSFTKSRRFFTRKEGAYRDLWKEIYLKYNVVGTKAQEELRHGMIIEAFGEYRNVKTWSNSDFDVMFGLMRQLLATGSYAVTERIVDTLRDEGDDRRWIAAIALLAHDKHIAKIARAKFGRSNWRMCPFKDLKSLMYTVQRWARSAKKNGKNVHADPDAVIAEDYVDESRIPVVAEQTAGEPF